MTHAVDSLLARYETGTLSRRDLVVALSALAAVPSAVRAQSDALRGRTLNHVSLIVSDLDRSVAGGPDATPHINHFCLGLGSFDPERTVRALGEAGVEATSRVRDGVPQVYCADPDNLRVQLQDTSFCGGVGPLGNECR